MKLTNAYEHILYFVINILCLLHVSATVLAILREVHYKGYVTNIYEPMHKCKMILLTAQTLRPGRESNLPS
jgi:hypothetical protein